MDIFSILIVVLILLAFASGFFDLISWAFNGPAIAVLVVFWLIAMYNGLVRKRNQADEAWSDIEVQLKRRYDLIPNVMESVKGYATHEKNVFERVTAARAAALGAQTLDDHAKAENMLSGTLKTLFAVAENYPELKANQNFLDLQRELADTENKIQAARRFFNTTVMEFNTVVQTFPTNVFAGMFGFAKKEFFDLDNAEEKNVPKVSF
ncbi:MAG: LemA family protein [Candidatus Sungbacteria bacterium]|nr:LemA family protein [Candidatus Sungbacteria bacterium]